MAKKNRLTSLDFDKLINEDDQDQLFKESAKKIKKEHNEPEKQIIKSAQSGSKEKKEPERVNNSEYSVHPLYYSDQTNTHKIYKPLHDHLGMFVAESKFKGIKTNIITVVNYALYKFLVSVGKLDKVKKQKTEFSELQIEKDFGKTKTYRLEDYTDEDLLALIKSSRENDQNIHIVNFNVE